MNGPAIRLVVFDMAGTILDHGSFAPVAALISALAELGISLDADEARGPMGLHKLDHIAELLRLETVGRQWKAIFGREPISADAKSLFERFLPLQRAEAKRRTGLIPGALSCLSALREKGIAVGTTTGYPRVIGEEIVEAVRAQGFIADEFAFPDDVAAGRPAPWMIFRIMERTAVYPATSVIKVGDTVPDIEEGRNAGAWSIGITETGSEIGMTLDDWQRISEADRSRLARAAADKLHRAGAHSLIPSVAELPALLDQFEAKNRRGERP